MGQINHFHNGVLVEVLTVPPEVENRQTVIDAALAALDTNRAFVALASPTNAQVLAQVKALSRQNNGVIRFLLNKFDGTD